MGSYLWITIQWAFEMRQNGLNFRVLMGRLLWLVVFVGFSLLPEILQRGKTKKTIGFPKTTNSVHKQTSGLERLKQWASLRRFDCSSKTAELHACFRVLTINYMFHRKNFLVHSSVRSVITRGKRKQKLKHILKLPKRHAEYNTENKISFRTCTWCLRILSGHNILIQSLVEQKKELPDPCSIVCSGAERWQIYILVR